MALPFLFLYLCLTGRMQHQSISFVFFYTTQLRYFECCVFEKHQKQWYFFTAKKQISTHVKTLFQTISLVSFLHAAALCGCGEEGAGLFSFQ